MLKGHAVYVLGLGFAVAAATGLAAGDTDPLTAADFDPKPGNVCTYEMNHNGQKAKWTLEVLEVTDTVVRSEFRRVGDSSESIPVVDGKSADGILVTSGMAVHHGTQWIAESGIQWTVFPLEPKKKWKSGAVISGTNAAGQAWKVKNKFSNKADKKWKKLKTPAGEFMTLKVVTKESITGLSGSFRGTGRVTYWFGRGDCPIKKWEYRNSFGEKGKSELIAEGSI